MKSITILFFTILAIISCKSVELNPNDIVGKWKPSLYIPYNSNNNTWGKAFPIDSLSRTQIIEFSSESKFLINGKSGGSCCNAGNKYTISVNEISFSDLNFNCLATQYCYNCAKWTIEKLDDETLILEECNNRKIQYVKTK